MTTTTQPRTFTSEQVLEHGGMTYRQLDHWVRQGWLNPTRQRASRHYGSASYGEISGNPRVWSEREAIKAVCLARMVRAGITPQRAAQFLDAGVLATLVTQPLPEVLSG